MAGALRQSVTSQTQPGDPALKCFACELVCQLLRLPLRQDGAGGAAGMLQQALNFVAPTLVVGGLELGLWNFAASSTQA